MISELSLANWCPLWIMSLYEQLQHTQWRTFCLFHLLIRWRTVYVWFDSIHGCRALVVSLWRKPTKLWLLEFTMNLWLQDNVTWLLRGWEITWLIRACRSPSQPRGFHIRIYFSCFGAWIVFLFYNLWRTKLALELFLENNRVRTESSDCL